MGKKLMVGNLAYGVTDDTLYTVFEPHGTVRSAQVVVDRATGASRGFGFVEMKSDAEAWAARKALHLTEIQGRCMTVCEAQAKPGHPGRGRRA